MALATASAIASAPAAAWTAVPSLEPSRMPPPARRSPAQAPARRAPARRAKLGPVGVSHRRASRAVPPRLTRRGVVACWLAALASVALAGFGLAHGLQPSAPIVATAEAITVQSGTSLWDLATRMNPTVDPRVTISAIREANGLGPNTPVQPGMTLSVPVYAHQ